MFAWLQSPEVAGVNAVLMRSLALIVSRSWRTGSSAVGARVGAPAWLCCMMQAPAKAEEL